MGWQEPHDVQEEVQSPALGGGQPHVAIHVVGAGKNDGRKGTGVPGGRWVDHEPVMCHKEGLQYCRLHEANYCQQLEGNDLFPLLSSGKATPGVLCPVVVLPVKERHGATGTGQWRDSKHLLCEECLKDLTHRRLRGSPINVYKYLKEGYKCRVRLFSVVPRNMTTGSGHNLEHRRFPFEHQPALLVMHGWQSTGTGT